VTFDLLLFHALFYNRYGEHFPMTKILIVEDMPDNAELVRRILSARGYEVFHAVDAETGLEMALAQHPDLILLDLGLPDYDGLTLAGWLRADDTLRDVPIIAHTAWPPDAARQMAETYGCSGYIGKPIGSVKEFVERIEKFLKVKKT
jgi:two-component system, cell cycle response regulator DivK